MSDRYFSLKYYVDDKLVTSPVLRGPCRKNFSKAALTIETFCLLLLSPLMNIPTPHSIVPEI